MITLRRDGMENDRSYVYDNYGEMSEKHTQATEAFGVESEQSAGTADSLVNVAALPQTGFSDYKSYLQQQLNREAPARLLTEEEFYSQQYGSASRVQRSSKKRSVKGKGNKRSFIFLATYVLMVAAVSFIIIALNSNDTKVNASNGAVEQEGQIQAMPIDRSAAAETNWFDRVLDGVSNK